MLELIKTVFSYPALLLVFCLIAGPVLVFLMMVFMIFVPIRDAPKSVWVFCIAFWAWHVGALLLAIFSPEHRELATMALFLTLPAMYTFGQVANLIFSLLKRGRPPRVGEWFD